jgi:hypothetical protein
MEQAEVIREGKNLTDPKYKDHHILLYKIDDLYVEVFYSKEHNIITKFNPFSNNVENPRKLTPFGQMKLTPLGHFKLTP